MALAVLVLIAEAVQLNVVSSSTSKAGAQMRVIPLQRGFEAQDELASALTPHNSSIAAAISSSLFTELARAQDARSSYLKGVAATFVEVSHTRELDVVRNLNGDDPSDRGAAIVPIDAAGQTESEGAARKATHGHAHATQDALVDVAQERASAAASGLTVTKEKNYADMAASLSTQPTADIGLLSVRDTQYMGWIRIGSQVGPDGLIGIPMRVVFDTGSTNLWITGNKCKKVLKAKYESAKSNSAVVDAKTYLVHIKFGTGQLSGTTRKDTVRVGPFKVDEQYFGEIEEEDGNIFNELDDFGGIMGLGHRDMSMQTPDPVANDAEDADNHVTPFFQHLIRTGQLSVPEFSMYMNAEKQSLSAILFGGVDSRVVQPPPAGKKMFQMGRVKGRGGLDGQQPHYWSVELYRIVYNKNCGGEDWTCTETVTGEGQDGCEKNEGCKIKTCTRAGDECTQVWDPIMGGFNEKVLSASFMNSFENPDAPTRDQRQSQASREGLGGGSYQPYLQDPALVFDSGTTLYTGPQDGVDEILKHIQPVKCGPVPLKNRIGTITYEVQGLKDPETECSDDCPAHGLGGSGGAPGDKGAQFCADVSNKGGPSTPTKAGGSYPKREEKSFEFGDCRETADMEPLLDPAESRKIRGRDYYKDEVPGRLCKCLHKNKRKIDIVLQPHQYMVHDGGHSDTDISGNMCRPGFWTINVPEPNGPAWLLGELYMRHFVTVYRHRPGADADHNEQLDPALVAWAPARHDPADEERKAFVAELSDQHPVYDRAQAPAASAEYEGPVVTRQKLIAQLKEKQSKGETLTDHEKDMLWTAQNDEELREHGGGGDYVIGGAAKNAGETDTQPARSPGAGKPVANAPRGGTANDKLEEEIQHAAALQKHGGARTPSGSAAFVQSHPALKRPRPVTFS